MKTKINVRNQALIFIKDCGNLKQLKNVKSNNNTMGSHLASCRVIFKPATMKYKKTAL